MSTRLTQWLVLLCVVIGAISAMSPLLQANEGGWSCCNYASECFGDLICCTPASQNLPPCSCGENPAVGYCRSSCR